ncbi:hypothetical protein U1Q18_021537 [Sarracenia purpurea var. burkii]
MILSFGRCPDNFCPVCFGVVQAVVTFILVFPDLAASVARVTAIVSLMEKSVINLEVAGALCWAFPSDANPHAASSVNSA